MARGKAAPRSGERSIEYRRLDELEPAKRNAKRHDIAGLIASFRRFGVTQAVAIVDERTGRMHAGHGRREALEQMRAGGSRAPAGIRSDDDGMWLVPIGRGWRSKNDRDAEAALLGDNQLTIAAGWDLAELNASLSALGPRGLTGTGFSVADLPGAPPAAPDGSGPIEAGDVPQLARRGDVWTIGPHRLMCGDCRDADDVRTLIDGGTVQLAVTSPPYADRRKYDGESEFRPIKPGQYVEWFRPVAENVAEHLAEDGSWCVNVKAIADTLDRELYVHDLVIAHVRGWGWHLADEFCWQRRGIPKKPRLRLKNAHEPVYHFARARWKFRPDHVMHESPNAIVRLDELDDRDRGWKHRATTGGEKPKSRARGVRGGGGEQHQGKTWAPGEATVHGMAYPSNLLPAFGHSEAVGHPATFPIELPEFFVKLLTDEGELVYDPFSGSGSTVLAADRAGRVGAGMEISPRYTNAALARLGRELELTPTRVGDGAEYPVPT